MVLILFCKPDLKFQYSCFKSITYFFNPISLVQGFFYLNRFTRFISLQRLKIIFCVASNIVRQQILLSVISASRIALTLPLSIFHFGSANITEALMQYSLQGVDRSWFSLLLVLISHIRIDEQIYHHNNNNGLMS
jgi:E3 ubiquitin-protein ligase DOA10